MNYLEPINQYNLDYRFLVSGNDFTVTHRVFHDLVHRSYQNNRPLVIINNDDFNDDLLKSFPYQMKDGFSSEYGLYNIFQLETLNDISKLRVILDLFHYDEIQKMKVNSYLQLIKYLERLQNNKNITIQTLMDYSSYLHFQNKINQLNLSDQEKTLLLTRYVEVSSIAADLEYMFSLLIPFIKEKPFQLFNHEALVYDLHQFPQDNILKELILNLILFTFERYKEEFTLIILDNSFEERKYLYDFIIHMPRHVEMSIFSNDIFTMFDKDIIPFLLDRFTVRIYSCHENMKSSGIIEKLLGDKKVIHRTVQTIQDRRIFAYSIWDHLLNRAKTEVYVGNPPVYEPKFPKETINSLPKSQAIMEFLGQSTMMGFW